MDNESKWLGTEEEYRMSFNPVWSSYIDGSDSGFQIVIVGRELWKVHFLNGYRKRIEFFMRLPDIDMG